MNVKYNESFNRIANTVKIEVMEAGLADLGREWRSEDMCSPYSRLYYVISGAGYLRLRGGDGKETEVYTMRPGYLYLIPNGLSYDYFCEDRLEKVYFHINVSLQNGLELFYGCRNYYEMQIGNETLDRMKQWITSSRPEDYFHMQGEIYHAVASFIKVAGLEAKVNRNYSEMVARLFALLPKLKISVSVRDMAKMLNVSESTLAKHFKKETGMSIGDYREQLVMGRARQLLALGKLSVGEIAEELGYCDQFYFSRYFKEHQGMTPSAYKQRYKISG
ncbi:MAG: helix-turn-helix transcriptional regulator [Roseburia sp.]|nr:helix-turn-helix transcriptional regulator [Roseburia sp.]